MRSSPRSSSFIDGGIGNSNVIAGAEAFAGNGGDVRFPQQFVGEIGSRFDPTASEK